MPGMSMPPIPGSEITAGTAAAGWTTAGRSLHGLGGGRGLCRSGGGRGGGGFLHAALRFQQRGERQGELALLAELGYFGLKGEDRGLLRVEDLLFPLYLGDEILARAGGPGIFLEDAVYVHVANGSGLAAVLLQQQLQRPGLRRRESQKGDEKKFFHIIGPRAWRPVLRSPIL